jgi:rare lipoprotein A
MSKDLRISICAVLCAFTASCSIISDQSPPASNTAYPGYSETGVASFYADHYQGKLTANGERYDRNKRTAAHTQLPFHSRVQVTNLDNKKSVVVEINDRGPFIKGRIIDLSRSAFRQIADTNLGVVYVRIEVLE